MAYEFLQEITEAGQFRTKSRTDAMGSDTFGDFAMMDLSSLYVMYNEPQYRQYAQQYAADTIKSRNFDRARVSSTDLYNAIFQSKQAGKRVNEPEVRRFLGSMASGKLTDNTARGSLQRIENSLGIKNTTIKSVRRRVQDYNKMPPSNKKVMMPMINKWYAQNGRYSTLYPTMQMLGAGDGSLTKQQVKQPILNWKKLAAVAVGGYALGRLAGRQKGLHLPIKSKAVINDENLVETTYKYQIMTLIDITLSSNRPKKHSKSFLQLQNFNTFIQACSFRTQVFEPLVAQTKQNVDNSFGTNYKGEMPVWTLDFYTEDAVPELKHDIASIPIIDVCENTSFEVIEVDDEKYCNTIVMEKL